MSTTFGPHLFGSAHGLLTHKTQLYSYKGFGNDFLSQTFAINNLSLQATVTHHHLGSDMPHNFGPLTILLCCKTPNRYT